MRIAITVALAVGLLMAVAAPAGAQVAELTYGGADISAGNGTMTITCSSTTPGENVWQLTLVRNTNSGGYGAKITAFNDLTDVADFNYAASNWGLFLCNWLRDDGHGITLVFEELAKTADMYQWRLTSVKGWTDPDPPYTVYENALTATYLYTINAATETGTVITCERTLTNTSGVELPGAQASDRMPTQMQLYDNAYAGDSLTPYEDVGGVYTRIHKLSDASDGIWKVTDNIKNRDANPCWGQGEVMDSDAVATLGLVPGRTFKITSDITSPSGTIVDINIVSGILYRIAYSAGFGQPNPIPVAWTQDYDVTLDINITDGAAPAAGDPDAAHSHVTAAPVPPAEVLADGLEEATVTIVLRDADSLVVTGYDPSKIEVTATDTGGDNAYGAVSEIGETGNYEATFTSLTGETKTVTVRVTLPDDSVITLDDHPTVEFVAVGLPDAEESDVTASIEILTANGFNTTTVTVTLKDADGHLVSGKATDLTVEATDTGADNVYGTVVETSAGVYTCTIASSTAENKAVTVTYKKADPEDEVGLDAHPTVEFIALPDAQLSYTGDIETADGVLTITCSDRTGAGSVWAIELTRQTGNAQRGALITGFDDLTDSGDFDYCGGAGYGMLNCNNIRADNVSITLAFEQLYRGADQYTWKITCVKPVGVSSSITTEHVYTINAALPVGTRITCDRTLAISGDEVVAADYNDRMPTEMLLNDNNYEDDKLSAYMNILGVWTRWHLLGDDSDAIWEITDNIVNRDAEACWGQGTVMANDETVALGLVAGRTFKLTTDITSPSGQGVFLHPAAGLDFRVAYTGGVGALRPAYPVTMDVNITDEPVAAPPVLEIAAEVTAGEEWVYQNTETTTDDRHISTATITLVSEATPGEVYDISIADDGPPGANFTLGAVTDNRPGDDTLVVEIIGGRTDASTIGVGGAAYNVTLTVEGQDSEESDSAQVQVSLLRIGDINRDGSLTGTDRQLFNQRLNNVATVYTDRTFDLDGSGGAPTGTDKQVMNQALNNVPLP